MLSNNYCAVVPQSYEERINMYMAHPKEELAQMLAVRDRFEFPQGCKECVNEEL